MNEYIRNINERGAYRHPVEDIEPLPESEILALADSMGRLFEFLCSSGNARVVGHRVLCVAYAMRPDLVGAKSEADLGRKLGISRAAVSKIISDYRDTFGLRTVAMRNEETRKKCRLAQLRR